MDFLLLTVERSFDPLRALFLVAPIYVLVEMMAPKVRVSWRSRLQSAVFGLVAIPFGAALYASFTLLWSRIGVPPLITLRLGDWFSPIGLAGAVLAAIVGTIIGDFFFYWMHRAQHRFFWRVHSVHHSIQELSAFSCYHHVAQSLFDIAFISLPMALLVRTDWGATPWIVATVIQTHTFWVHSSSRLHWGPLRRIFDDARFHRVHHSRDPGHMNKNFGGFSTIWDQLFGTAYFPAKDEWPEVGIADQPEPQSVREFIMAPFRATAFAARPSSGTSPIQS